jgi:hypothetical protein
VVQLPQLPPLLDLVPSLQMVKQLYALVILLYRIHAQTLPRMEAVTFKAAQYMQMVCLFSTLVAQLIALIKLHQDLAPFLWKRDK